MATSPLQTIICDADALKRPLCVLLDQSLKYLPYRQALLESLRSCQKLGRKLVLATSTDSQTAAQIAERLGCFDAVHHFNLETDPDAVGLRDRLTSEYGAKGFDCLGDADTQVALLEAARLGCLVDASPVAIARTRRLKHVTIISRLPSKLRALASQLRPHQWAKNSLVLLPALLAPEVPNTGGIARGALAFITFSCCASAGYVLNDLLDIEADRMHATKYRRPFASGALPVAFGPPLFVALLAVSFLLTWAFLPRSFLLMLALYFCGTVTYSLYFKRLSMVDVLLLAGLYTLRILAGGIATSIKVSTWLLGFSMFLFTSLAFAKRYVELRPLTGDTQVKNRGYSGADTAMVASMGTASGFISALVFTLYVDSAAVRVNYRTPALLWLVLPLLLYWLGRIWLLAARGQMRDDPVKFALRDRVSLMCALVIGFVMAAARYAPGWLSQPLH